jgi:hypothetical protein
VHRSGGEFGGSTAHGRSGDNECGRSGCDGRMGKAVGLGKGGRTMSTNAITQKIARLGAKGRPRLLDLFAGCGGLSLGFRQSRAVSIGRRVRKPGTAVRRHSMPHSAVCSRRHIPCPRAPHRFPRRYSDRRGSTRPAHSPSARPAAGTRQHSGDIYFAVLVRSGKAQLLTT